MSPRIDSEASTAEPTHQARLELGELGDLWLAWNDRGLVRCEWLDRDPPELPEAKVVRRIPAAYGKPLRAYAAGGVVDPAELPVDLRQGTPFQREVWTALRTLRRGEVRSYASVARAIDNPRAMRAIGMANAANPLVLVVPCHRVVAAGLQLGGYSGGLERKRRLLELEGVVVDGETLRPGQLSFFD